MSGNVLKSDILWEKMRLALQAVDPKNRTLVGVFQFSLKKDGAEVKKISKLSSISNENRSSRR